MATITITGFIQASKDHDGTVRFMHATSEDMTRFGYAFVMPLDVTFELPEDFDFNTKQIAMLERKRAAALDEAAQAARELAQLGKLAQEPPCE
jgi:hypothetical protein